jgi:5-(carboxyamino)imidazole ribonucleotide mutase
MRLSAPGFSLRVMSCWLLIHYLERNAMSELKPLVGILMGSENDYEIMIEAARALKGFGIGFEMTVSSAHRSPGRTARYAREARQRGLRVLIVGAGAAAHLAGVVAAETTLPVIGVPIDSSSLWGFDALLSTVQMPAGVPVATMALGKAGARNAGIFAAQILGSGNAELALRLDEFKGELAASVEARAQSLQERLALEKF